MRKTEADFASHSKQALQHEEANSGVKLAFYPDTKYLLVLNLT